MNFFQQTSNIKDVDKPYFINFMKKNLDIVTQCRFKLPRKNKWKGHPFYYDSLDTIQKINGDFPNNIHELISTPIWFNKYLNTRFDCDLARKGFIFVKDIISEGEVLNSVSVQSLNISKKIKNKIIKMCEMLPLNFKTLLFKNKNLVTVPFPQTSLKIGQAIKYLLVKHKIAVLPLIDLIKKINT